MNCKRTLSGTGFVAVLLLAGGAAFAQDKSIHITGSSNVSSLNINDGAGYRWDITSNGIVNDGTNDAYDGGMQLTVNNNSFYWSSASKMSADGREIEMGPFSAGQVSVYRRIYVDPKMGYCRWIDIFENNGPSTASLNLQYFTNTGGSTQQIWTTSGKDQLTERDWGVMTAYNDSASNPALVHFFATKSAKLRPKFQYRLNDDNLYYTMTLAVPSRKAAALCFFEAQRRPIADAKKMLAEFNINQELEKVPVELRRLLANMSSGATMMLGKVELTRNEKQDLAVLRNGDELLGELLPAKYEIETFYGKLSLDAGRVVGLVSPDADDPVVQAVLVDGQVVSGKLLSLPVKMKLANGSEMALDGGKFAALSYRLSKDKPDDVGQPKAAVVLRSGQQLYFAQAGLDATFQCEYGELKLDPDDLGGLLMDTPEGGLHRAVFRNGSVLSGLLKAQGQKLQLDLGLPLTLPASMIEKFVFPTGESDRAKLIEVTLRNEDQLMGLVLDQKLTVQSRLGEVNLKPAEIAEMQFLPDALGQVQIRLHNGTTVTGRLAQQSLKFKIEPGPELSLFVGHIIKLTAPSPDAPATSPAATMPAPPKPPGPPVPGPGTPGPMGSGAVDPKLLSPEDRARFEAELKLRVAQPQMDRAKAAELEAARKAAADREAADRDAAMKAEQAKRQAEEAARAAAAAKEAAKEAARNK